MALTTADVASAVLALSKAAWKLATSFAKLDQDVAIVDTSIQNLAGEVRSLGNECDLVYAELEEAERKSETEPLPPYDVDGRMWSCLVTQVEDTSRTIQELELFLKSTREEGYGFVGQPERQRKLDKRKAQIASIRTRIRRHTYNLRDTLLLINAVFANIALSRDHLDKLQDMVEKLQRSSQAYPRSRLSHAEATLLECAREVLVKDMAIYEANLAASAIAAGQRASNGDTRVAEWMSTVESIRRDQRLSDVSDAVSNLPSVFSGNDAHTVVTSPDSARDPIDAEWDDSDDDLHTDLAKAALDTGTKAFEAQEWEEADSLLREALSLLQQLPNQQRAFCDIFGLQYKLAVCAYHTREPADAEEALTGLVQLSANSDEQRGYIQDAVHMLSLLHLRMGQVDRARSECEKALHARRRLLGKLSDASLESTALMAHICFLLSNDARAKSYLAMVPEARRDTVMKTVQESLGPKVEPPDALPLSTGTNSKNPELAVTRIQRGPSVPPPALPPDSRHYGSGSAMIAQSPGGNTQRPQLELSTVKAGSEDLRSITVTSLSSAEERSESRASESDRASERGTFAYPEAPSGPAAGPGKPPDANETFKAKIMSRKEILENIGCQPRDRIEEAVCDGDHLALVSLLSRKKDSWRSRFRKPSRPERVTALHFAALFDEIGMARRLLGSNFDVNVVPFGYSTNLTPLKFAIGARQVEMVEFLVINGARPSEPDSWSTMAAQLMNRSWLKKTMSEAEKEAVPARIIVILGILLQYGWDVNAPFETSGRTVLEQAVTFWTGSYKWDLSLRAAVTSFLCEQGANPFQANAEGKTPYAMALASGHQDLLRILIRGSKQLELEPVELPAD